MSTIHFHQNMTNGVTVIKNSFIDHYMLHANGEYVKIYLYILRCLEDSLFSASLSLTDFADVFDCTEKDVLRALRYWEQMGLISMTFQADTLTDIQVNELSQTQPAAATEEIFAIPLSKSTSQPDKKSKKSGQYGSSANMTQTYPATNEPYVANTRQGYADYTPQVYPSANVTYAANMPQSYPSASESYASKIQQDFASADAIPHTVSRAAAMPLGTQGFDVLSPQQNFDVSAIQHTQPAFESRTAQQFALMQASGQRQTVVETAENPIDVSTERLNQLISDNKVRELLFVAQTYLEKTLSSQETNILLYFYDTLKFSTELIEFLLEYSAGTGHRNLRYIEKIGLTWHEEGIETVQQAKEFTENHSKIYTSILKTFGISGRFLTPVEKNFIAKWTNEFGFSLDLILEACSRTIQTIQQPSFPYTDSILTNWHNQTVSDMEDVKRLDCEHKQKQRQQIEQKVQAPAQTNTARKTGFHNFPQQNYNLDELELALLQRHQ